MRFGNGAVYSKNLSGKLLTWLIKN